MEKLIELLNEYEKSERNRTPWSYEDYFTWKTDFERKDGTDCERFIISKSYGFVEWLVNNEKLTTDFAVKESGLNAITMLLALAPNPISFLISLLK